MIQGPRLLLFAIVASAALECSNNICEKGWHDWHEVYRLHLTMLFEVSKSFEWQRIYCYNNDRTYYRKEL